MDPNYNRNIVKTELVASNLEFPMISYAQNVIKTEVPNDLATTLLDPSYDQNKVFVNLTPDGQHMNFITAVVNNVFQNSKDTNIAVQLNYLCNICKITFTAENDLQNHMKLHTQVVAVTQKPNVKVPTAVTKFKPQFKLNKDKKRHVCNQCGKSFARRLYLTNHIATHNQDKPFSCVTCGKCFRQSINLTNHQRIHTGEKPHICTVCSKAFTQISNLTNHFRTHTGDRPHHCEVCGKGFIQSGNLTIHRRTHTGEKPYMCKNCGKAFSQMSNLSNHLRTHTGEKPFACPVCGHSFIQIANLKKHMKNHG